MNPAYAAMVPGAEAGLTYRNQWPGIPATFVTYGAMLVVPINSFNSGMGLQVLNDVQGGGVFSNTSATLQYGYRMQAGRNWMVSGGISGSYVMKQFDSDALVFRTDVLNDLGYPYGNVTYPGYSRSYPDFSAGFMATRDDKLTLGVSVSHLTRPRSGNTTSSSGRIPFRYAAFVSAVIEPSGRNRGAVGVEPAAYLSWQGTQAEIMWGSNFRLVPSFTLGGFVRHSARLQVESVSLAAGLFLDHYNIFYTYDVNLKKIHLLSTKMAAHEVTFLYRFEYKQRKMKKVECPAY